MSKSISTHREDPLIAASHAAVAVALRDMHPQAYRKQRQAGQRSALAKFERLSTQYSDSLAAIVSRAEAGDSTALRAPVKLITAAYREAFSYGLMAGGRTVISTGVPLTPKDEQWITSAVAEEARYWRSFMRSALAGTGRMSHAKRKEMYVKTLRSIYETGRVMALPEQVLLYWVMDTHKEHCPQCQFLASNGPYTKDTIPTTPRASECSCKSNCACHILVRHVDALEYTRVKSQLPNKKELSARLKRVSR